MNPQQAHDLCQEALTSYFLQHGVFPSDLEVTIEVLWAVVAWAREHRVALPFVPNNRRVPVYAFYGVKLIPVQDLSAVDSIVKTRCVG